MCEFTVQESSPNCSFFAYQNASRPLSDDKGPCLNFKCRNKGELVELTMDDQKEAIGTFDKVSTSLAYYIILDVRPHYPFPAYS